MYIYTVCIMQNSIRSIMVWYIDEKVNIEVIGFNFFRPCYCTLHNARQKYVLIVVLQALYKEEMNIEINEKDVCKILNFS